MSIIDTRPRDGSLLQRILFGTRRNAADGMLLALRLESIGPMLVFFGIFALGGARDCG